MDYLTILATIYDVSIKINITLYLTLKINVTLLTILFDVSETKLGTIMQPFVIFVVSIAQALRHTAATMLDVPKDPLSLYKGNHWKMLSYYFA